MKCSARNFSILGLGFIKGKSVINIARDFGDRQRNFRGENFWVRDYYVSTIGRDAEVIKAYIRSQEAEARKLEQQELLG
jgi:putative transposase